MHQGKIGDARDWRAGPVFEGWFGNDLVQPDTISRAAAFTAMPSDPPPIMERYSRHVLVCVGGFCSPDRGGRALYAHLAALLQREGLLFGPRRVKRSETPCLGVCGGGPIVAVYPEGVWYAAVTPAFLERIVVEHLRDGRIIEDAVFHRLGG